MSKWTLFSNHGHVLLYLSLDPEVRLRDVAAKVGITERAVQKIVRDLQDAGMLTVIKHGRRNRYRIHTRKHLRHDLESHCTVGQLVDLIGDGEVPARVPEDRPAAPAQDRPEPRAKPVPPAPVTPAAGVEPPREPPAEARATKAGRRDQKPDAPVPDPGDQGSLF